MKKTHIIGLVAIAIAIAALISIAGDASVYTDFETALVQTDRNHQVVGHLSLDKAVEYQPEIDPNSFVFHMKDKNGKEQKVRCLIAKPQDFERSEQIVLTGRMRGDVFEAHDIQLKCPSKYKDEALQNAEL